MDMDESVNVDLESLRVAPCGIHLRYATGFRLRECHEQSERLSPFAKIMKCDGPGKEGHDKKEME